MRKANAERGAESRWMCVMLLVETTAAPIKYPVKVRHKADEYFVANPAPARTPIVTPLDLCRAALHIGGLEGRILPDQMKAALGGLANLYGLHALAIGKEEFSIQTEGGFLSKIIPVETALQEIRNCTGVTDRPVLEKILESLGLALEAEFAGKAQLAVEIPGFGTFVRSQSGGPSFTLHFAFP